MKIFATILSFYILILTAIPCIDEPNDNSLQKVELSQKTADNNQHNADHCSPFCTCYCCVSPIFYQVYTIQFSNFLLVQKFYSDYKSTFISSLYTSIWQPPKLS